MQADELPHRSTSASLFELRRAPQSLTENEVELFQEVGRGLIDARLNDSCCITQ
jgi:hypothetical protein